MAGDERGGSGIVDPARLNAGKLTLDEVDEALRASNPVASVGRLPRDRKQFLVLSSSELATIDDVKRVVIAFRDQTPICVSDVAEVREGTLDRTTLISGSGEPAAVVNVSRQIGGNILQIAEDVERTLREEARSLPPALRIAKVYDLATFVRHSVRSVRDAIIMAACWLPRAVVLRATGGDARRRSLAAADDSRTFGILALSGGTANLMSMGGLAIAMALPSTMRLSWSRTSTGTSALARRRSSRHNAAPTSL